MASQALFALSCHSFACVDQRGTQPIRGIQTFSANVFLPSASPFSRIIFASDLSLAASSLQLPYSGPRKLDHDFESNPW